MSTDTKPKTSSMDSSFPVLVPYDPALFLPNAELEKHVYTLLSSSQAAHIPADVKMTGDAPSSDDDFTMVSGGDQSTLKTDDMKTDPKTGKDATGHPFMDALLKKAKESKKSSREQLEAENKMFTENAGVAYKSTNDPRLDLFTELEKTISGLRMKELLEASWAVSPEDTLRIVWNARSIHLGKGDRQIFYRALGWMREHGHEKTVLQNLRWVMRAVIEKRVKKEKDEKDEKDTDGDAVMVGTDAGVEKKEDPEEDPARFDVTNGVAHGYWKDLLNLLVLEVEDAFNVLTDPDSILAVKNEQQKKSAKSDHTSPLRGSHRGRGRGGMRGRGMARGGKVGKREERKPKELKEVREARAVEMNEKHKQEAKERRHQEEARAHEKFTLKFNAHDGNNFYQALHLMVSSLFAEQLRKDMDLLKAGKKKDLNRISHAAKWAPSLEGFHDKHTFIASSIAEILFPQSAIGEEGGTRETYLKRAREWYRKFTLSPLRKALEVVERDISAETFDKIKYERIPSVAMDKNKDLFIKKDFDHFEKYIDGVAQNKGRISGAVLIPSVLVHQVRQATPIYGKKTKQTVKELLESKMQAMSARVVNEQWKTLVQRIKDSGKLQDSIAVCDVSGSMSSPVFKDGTCPMDSAIGLSLLISEITKAPFGGTFISFHEEPTIHRVGGPEDMRSFTEKVQAIMASDWGYNTNFLAVFEDLLLPIAVMNKLKQEDMVKQVFVFSDMQFDEAQTSNGRWSETAYERLQRVYKEAGYELPKLIFWNLAGGRAGYHVFGAYGDERVPKPVTSEIPGTAIVSGYSQGQLKMFLDEGMFEDEEEEEEEVADVDMKEGGEGETEVMVEVKKVKKQADPMAALKKAIGHKAYAMLKVVD